MKSFIVCSLGRGRNILTIVYALILYKHAAVSDIQRLWPTKNGKCEAG